MYILLPMESIQLGPQLGSCQGPISTGLLERWRKLVSRSTLKNFDYENVQSESLSIRTSKGRAPASELELLKGGLPSEIALQRGASSPKLCIEG